MVVWSGGVIRDDEQLDWIDGLFLCPVPRPIIQFCGTELILTALVTIKVLSKRRPGRLFYAAVTEGAP